MQHLEQEFSDLKQRLLTMASKAGDSVNRAIKALVERDDDLAHAVEADDSEIDRLEMELDERTVQMLSKAPLASDLRLLIVSLKICQNLERIGDEATTIARRSRELSQEPQLKPYIDIPRMSQLALSMLSDAMDAFVRGDTAKAAGLIPKDKEIDGINKQLQRELSSYMVERPATISRCLNLMTVSKCLERIADHVKNIAQQVVYLTEGRDIRHPGQHLDR